MSFCSKGAFLALVLAACAPPPEPTIPPAESEAGALRGDCIPFCAQFSCGHGDDGCGGTVWCGACDCPSSFRACEIELPVIYELPVQRLNAGQTVSYSTSALSTGADSVLHLVNAKTGQELAMNDNESRGAFTSVITYTAIQTVDVVLVARARSSSTQGTATLKAPSGVYTIPLGFREQWIDAPRAGDVLETVRLPDDGNATHVVYEMADENILRRHVGGGIANAVAFNLTAATRSRVLLGQSQLGGKPTAPTRLVRNDKNVSGHDDGDHDGLGFELEAALGTCASQSGTAVGRDGHTLDCASLTDPRDSDGDGLFDEWETIGRRTATGDLPLPLWGARARRKDLFLEADWGLESASDLGSRVSTTAAERLVAIYADRIAPLTLEAAVRHAATVKNPDGSIGLAAHVDIGRPAAAPSQATHYGDWGGFSLLPYVLTETGTGVIPASQAWPIFMRPERIGVFRYWVASASGGGQLSDRISFNAGNSGSTAAHEFGHTLGLAHSGVGRPGQTADPNCKPNYPSLMNYAFSSAGFSDGTNGPVLNNAALVEKGDGSRAGSPYLVLLSEDYSYPVDLTTGDIDWNRDGVIAPAGTTVRAYANSKPGNLCEYTRYNATPIDTFTTTVGPALTRFDGRVLVFYGGTNQLRYVIGTSFAACAVNDGTPCSNIVQSGALAIDATGGVDAVHMRQPERTAIIARGADGTIRMLTLDRFDALLNPVFSTPLVLPGPAASGEPSVTLDTDGSGLVLYRDQSGFVYQAHITNGASSAWLSSALPVRNELGQPIQLTNSHASPAAAVAPLPLGQTPIVPTLFALFASDSGALLYYRHADGSFRQSPYVVPLTPIAGRPALQWVTDPSNQTLGGYFVIAAPLDEYGDPEKRRLWLVRSYNRTVGALDVRIGLKQGYDSAWAYSYGIDFLDEPGVDDHLRAAWTMSTAFPEGKRQKAVINPKADGTGDFAYGDNNDWQVLRVVACSGLAPDTGVRCPAPDWF